MKKHGVKKLVFSSSATVYGNPREVPIKENFPLQTTCPYGRTKLFMEHVIRDIHKADPSFKAAILRYFNPIGAHPSGEIGEDPQGIPNNLVPYIAQVAVGRYKKLSVFGGDYPTPDGTGIRDYIHIADLTRAHVKALAELKSSEGVQTFNLGRGRGYSVLEVISAFEKASGRKIPYEIISRREGDVAQCYADASLAEEKLSWKAERDILSMCKDVWKWQSQYPNGL